MLSSARRPIEYSILVDPKPAGPTIGHYAERTIPERVQDAFGRLYVYAGIASRRADGNFDDEALRPGEFIMLPGLIYRYKS
jgi:hypothetical protein